MKKWILFLSLGLGCTSRASTFSTNAGVSVNGCSGALFKMDGRKDSQKALVITNGHCVRLKALRQDATDYPGACETIFDIRGEAVTNSTTVLLHGAKGSFEGRAERLIFATMNGTDISIFELRESYATLAQRYGMSSLRLDPRPLADGDRVSVHAPVFNRTQSCTINGRVDLAEGPYRTHNALRLSSECAIYNGFSGAPIIREDGHTFAGLANTHHDAEAQGPLCGFGKTCEVNRTTGELRAPAHDQSYGVAIDPLYTCFDGDAGEFDFRKDGCAYRLSSLNGSYPRLAGAQVQNGDPENATLVVIEKVGGDSHVLEKCSGAFVARDVVLTAAHCVDGGIGLPGDFVYPLSTADGYDPLRGEKRKVVKTVIHPKKKDLDVWLPITEKESYPFDNPDMALLKLESPYEGAVPAELATQELQAGDHAVFAGFGRGKQSWARPDRIDYTILKSDYQAIAPDYSDLTEKDGMRGFMDAVGRGFSLINPYFYFARSPEPGVQTTCYGDSGGPLYTLKNGRMKIYGVTSIYFPHPYKGHPGCENAFLGLFAKISPHLSWLKSEISKLSSED